MVVEKDSEEGVMDSEVVVKGSEEEAMDLEEEGKGLVAAEKEAF